MSEVAAVAKLVEPIDAPFATAMRTRHTKVTRLPAEFFQNGRLYRIVVNDVYGPQLLTLGLSDPGFAVSLGSNPEGFDELARRAGLRLDTPDRRSAYARAFLETTKDLTRRNLILQALPPMRRDVPQSPAEQAQYGRLRSVYGELIRPLSLSAGPPWKGELYALVVWDLVRYDVTVFPDGKVEVVRTVVEQEVPAGLDLTGAKEPDPAQM